MPSRLRTFGRTLALWAPVGLCLLAVGALYAVDPAPAGAPGKVAAGAAKVAPADPAAARAGSRPDAPVPTYQPPVFHATGTSTSMLMLRALVSLGVVIGLIFITAWLYKIRSGIVAAPTGLRVRVIETVALGPSRTLHLVALGEQVLLLGSGGGPLTTLATFKAADIGYDPHEAPPESFLAKLRSAGGDS